MLKSNIPESLVNQVSSESLDTFLNVLSTTSGREDLEMDQQSDSSFRENSRHSNVKHPATMPSIMCINNEPQDNNFVEEGQESKLAVKGSDNAASIANARTNALQTQSNRMEESTTANAVSATQAFSGTVPEFLYQLFKMLTDNNREVIEWADGKYLYQSIPVATFQFNVQ